MNKFLTSTTAAALIAATVVTSGLIKINVSHSVKELVPLADFNVIETRSSLFGLTNTIHIRLDNEIKDTNSVKHIVKALQNATGLDTVYIHVAGRGGQVESVEYIINNMIASKARVITIVEGPSYSGHAFIASFGDEIRFAPLSYLMFHHSSAYGAVCQDNGQTDRTVSEKVKCEAFLSAHLKMTERMIRMVRFLSNEDIELILTGHDVYYMPDGERING